MRITQTNNFNYSYNLYLFNKINSYVVLYYFLKFSNGYISTQKIAKNIKIIPSSLKQQYLSKSIFTPT